MLAGQLEEIVKAASTLSQRARQRLRARHLVLWAGPAFVADDGALSAPWEAVYINTPDGSIEEAFRRGQARNSAAIIAYQEPAEASAFSSSFLFQAVIYLEGGPAHRPVTERQRVSRRNQMVQTLSHWIGESLLVIAGYKMDDPLLVEHLDEIAESFPTASVLLLSTTDEAGRRLEEASNKEPFRSLRTATSLDLSTSAKSLPEWLGDLKVEGIDLFRPEERARILVGRGKRETTIDVSQLLRGRDRRLDETFRLVTTAATVPPDPKSLDDDSFRALMVSDESRSARTCESDLLEWQGFAGRFYYQREFTVEKRSFAEAVADRLERVAIEEMAKPIIYWLDCQANSGTTTFLHGLAFEVATKGFPTLVLKQDALNVNCDDVSDFLHGVRAEHLARQGDDPERDQVEVPALIIMDVQHELTPGALDLPFHLIRTKRPAVFVWAIRHDDQEPIAKHPVLGPISARSESIITPLFSCSITLDETKNVYKHFAKFGEPPYSLKLNQAMAAAIERIEQDPYERKLFWVQLYYNLRPGGAATLREHFVQKLRRVLVPDEVQGTPEGHRRTEWYAPALLQLAKLSRQRVPVPQDVLRAWLAKTFPHQPRPGVDESVRELQEFADAVDSLVEDGLVRRSDDTETRTAYLRMAHQIYGRLILDAFAVVLADHTATLVPIAERLALGVDDPGCESSQWYVSMFQTVRNVPTQVRFAEDMANAIIPDDLDSRWESGENEKFLPLFAAIPEDVLNSSDSLLHKKATILRRSTFAHGLSKTVRIKRLEDAWQFSQRALQVGDRLAGDDSSNVATTAGFVAFDLAKKHHLDQWRTIASDAFRDALERLPQNEVARQGNAELNNWLAATILESDPAKDLRREAYIFLSETLRLLSGEPNQRYSVRWHKTRLEALEMINTDDGKKFVDELMKGRVDAGFVIAAEMRLKRSPSKIAIEEGNVRAALAILKQAVEAPDRTRFPASTRFALELMEQLPEEESNYDARFRLLHTLEDQVSLTADEEFLLAYLAFQIGLHAEGRKRFARLRDTRRNYEVTRTTDRFWLRDRTSPTLAPRAFVAKIRSIQSDLYGYVDIVELGQDPIPFRPSYWKLGGRTLRGTPLDCCVRFEPSGPKAVPTQFYRRG